MSEPHEIKLHPQAQFLRCPFAIMMPEHYRPDGSCKCNNAEHRKMMIEEWEYKAKDFRKIPLID